MDLDLKYQNFSLIHSDTSHLCSISVTVHRYPFNFHSLSQVMYFKNKTHEDSYIISVWSFLRKHHFKINDKTKIYAQFY